MGEPQEFLIHFDVLDPVRTLLSIATLDELIRTELKRVQGFRVTGSSRQPTGDPHVDRLVFAISTRRSARTVEREASSIERSVALYGAVTHARNRDDAQAVVHRLRNERRSLEVARTARDRLTDWAAALRADLDQWTGVDTRRVWHSDRSLLRLVMDQIGLLTALWPELRTAT